MHTIALIMIDMCAGGEYRMRRLPHRRTSQLGSDNISHQRCRAQEGAMSTSLDLSGATIVILPDATMGKAGLARRHWNLDCPSQTSFAVALVCVK